MVNLSEFDENPGDLVETAILYDNIDISDKLDCLIVALNWILNYPFKAHLVNSRKCLYDAVCNDHIHHNIINDNILASISDTDDIFSISNTLITSIKTFDDKLMLLGSLITIRRNTIDECIDTVNGVVTHLLGYSHTTLPMFLYIYDNFKVACVLRVAADFHKTGINLGLLLYKNDSSIDISNENINAINYNSADISTLLDKLAHFLCGVFSERYEYTCDVIAVTHKSDMVNISNLRPKISSLRAALDAISAKCASENTPLIADASVMYDPLQRASNDNINFGESFVNRSNASSTRSYYSSNRSTVSNGSRNSPTRAIASSSASPRRQRQLPATDPLRSSVINEVLMSVDADEDLATYAMRVYGKIKSSTIIHLNNNNNNNTSIDSNRTVTDEGDEDNTNNKFNSEFNHSGNINLDENSDSAIYGMSDDNMVHVSFFHNPNKSSLSLIDQQHQYDEDVDCSDNIVRASAAQQPVHINSPTCLHPPSSLSSEQLDDVRLELAACREVIERQRRQALCRTARKRMDQGLQIISSMGGAGAVSGGRNSNNSSLPDFPQNIIMAKENYVNNASSRAAVAVGASASSSSTLPAPPAMAAAVPPAAWDIRVTPLKKGGAQIKQHPCAVAGNHNKDAASSSYINTNRNKTSNSSNVQSIKNSINSNLLAAAHMSDERNAVLDLLNLYHNGAYRDIYSATPINQFVVLLNHSKCLSFRAIYGVSPVTGDVFRICGKGPRLFSSVYDDAVMGYLKYESSSKSFKALPTRRLTGVVDALSVDGYKLKKIKQRLLC